MGVKFSLQKLGDYVYKSNTNNDAYDFSNDENFIKLIKKIKKLKILLI